MTRGPDCQIALFWFAERFVSPQGATQILAEMPICRQSPAVGQSLRPTNPMSADRPE